MSIRVSYSYAVLIDIFNCMRKGLLRIFKKVGPTLSLLKSRHWPMRRKQAGRVGGRSLESSPEKEEPDNLVLSPLISRSLVTHPAGPQSTNWFARELNKCPLSLDP